MSKTKRIKPDVLVVADVPHAKQLMAELAEIGRELAEIDAGMNEVIDLAKANAAGLAAEPAARRKAIETALAAFAVTHKAGFFAKKKSLDLDFGLIGFRMASKLKTATKTTWAQVLENLKSFRFLDAIRTKEEVDKEVLGSWPDERLATVGVTREVTDEFYIEVKQDAVADKAA